ncbi:MAG: hypothetical protein SCH71_16700 [Desulfobulbaceae bacterium]|nr:hypothetical protein [Desulfobulbaceae bacterium]
MKILGRKEIGSLVEKKSDYCVSIYLPVHRLGDPQDTIRYKNLLGEAEKMLVEMGMRSVEAVEFLAPEHALLDDYAYWKNLGSEGLAVFFCAGMRERFLLPRRFSESVTVAGRFRVKPLIPLVTGDGRFFILTLSKGSARLFIGSRFSISKIGLPEGAPASLMETLKYDDPERQLQFHTQTSGTGGRRQAMFHGHGVGIDEEKENITRFCQQLDKKLYPIFFGEKIPVVLAGIASLPPLYREVESSGMLVSQSVDIDPEALSPESLHREAWELAAPLFAEEEKKARDKFHQLHGTGLAVTDITDIVAAAGDGRIETLFILEDEELWGVFDPGKNMIMPTTNDFPGTVDLLDLAVASTLVNKGNIYVKKPGEMPVAENAAAILRYS